MFKKNSFDLVRVVAALVVMVSHAFALTGLTEPELARGFTLGNIGVYVFFALSGYLVFQSLDRDPQAFRFLARRALRIFPGLAVMLFVTVVALGLLVGSLPVGTYFAQQETWAYLGKIKLWGSDRLPGVFEHNAYPGTVNGSLWSLKWEWLMYCLLAGLAFVPRSWRSVGVLALAAGFAAVAVLSDLDVRTGPLVYLSQLSSFQNPFPPGSFFWLGALLAVLREYRARFSRLMTAAALIGVGIILAVNHHTVLLVGFWLLIPAGILSFGESALEHRFGLDIRDDISYGLYIYAFPIQQSIAALAPGFNWWQSLLVAVPFTALFAFISWRAVERPALRLKRHIEPRPEPVPSSFNA